MAKVTLTIEDDFKDGNPVIKGQFHTEEAPSPLAPNLPPIATPAQMYMTTIQRMWDQGVFNTFIRLCVPDMLYRNDQVKAQLARIESGSAIVNAPGGGPIIEGKAVEVPTPANDASGAPATSQEDDPDGKLTASSFQKTAAEAHRAVDEVQGLQDAVKAFTEAASPVDEAEQAGAGRGQPI